jgi:hypothetical protein
MRKTWGREVTDKSGKVLKFVIPKFPKYNGDKVPEDYKGQERYGVLSQNKTRSFVRMRYTKDGNLVPVRPDPQEPTWQLMSNPEVQIYESLHEDADRRFDPRQFWDKYGAIIMQGTMIMAIVIIVIVFQDNLSNLIDAGRSANAQCTQALTTCRQICDNAAGGVV